MGKIFIIPFHVKRMEPSIMPSSLEGAYVSCYASGRDYAEAAEKCLTRLIEDGLHPEEILQPIHEMRMEDWAKHVNDVWKDQATSLPDQAAFEEAIEGGAVVYGPFGSYT
ncbi:hypothetical protein [Burkholderia sp. BCC1977]|uniref:hypothetical protein n=1 Tax=Burkholderia sp. BCC1977 TaxID=2817440 RepID=UPI002ABD767F|nr:hypothetical protein [Burkholderia sp. BCC1977]